MPFFGFFMNDFTHLHCHTEFSLLDGAIKISDLCQQAVDFGLSSVAITDHGNMFGALDLYFTAKSYGIKPIIGCEMYVAPGSRFYKDKKGPIRSGYHLVLLCQNQEGYRNLLRLVSKGYLEGFHYKPRIDKELLSKYNDGLIALSACLKGEVPYTMMNNGFEAGLACAKEYADFFPGRFYLELQANGLPEQTVANAKLKELAAETGLPLIATNDCHYLTADDVDAHDVLLCIQTGAKQADEKRMRFGTRELYFKSPEKMEEDFADCPEALKNVGEVVRSCNLELELNKHFFPVYEVASGKSTDEEFVDLCYKGLKERFLNFDYPVDEKIYTDRLQLEIDVICQMGFTPYFLIVQDFINWAKGQGIPVGPGRGSAAGSLVAYSLRITDLDPLRYNLLFERFLNVERVSMPDIDVDFCYNRREEVIRYVSEKYGQDNVAQITTFGKMKARAVIRDVGRVLDIPLSYVDKIAKLIPGDLDITIDKAVSQEPELVDLMEKDPSVKQLFAVSRKLEGLSRHVSTHAAGIVISDKPMSEYLPLYAGKKGEVVTQYDKNKVEAAGLIKFDFLGLKTLTVISDALRLIANSGKTPPNIETLPLDDKASYDLLSSAETDGVFQLESSGMKKVLRNLKPSCFEDIIALLALYRPGPLESGMVDDFIARKHGIKKIAYEYDCLAEPLHPILSDTYGVILYQEQVMQIAGKLANYSLGEGDMLRRAMGKKDPAVMAQQRSRFMQGAVENGYPSEAAAYIFDLMEKFAGYGFNKSHSAAYALISYQTAYLKVHYPVEFMAALITSEVTNTDKIVNHVNACLDMQISVLPPDVNSSFSHFSVEDGKMRYGLLGVKGIGGGAIEAIVNGRKDKPYESLLDFCERVDLRKCNKKVLEQLVKCGAMDGFGCSRGMLLAGMGTATEIAQKYSRRATGGQLNFLDILEQGKPAQSGLGFDFVPEENPELSEQEKYRLEKEVFGFFFSGNPLLEYRDVIFQNHFDTLKSCRDMEPNEVGEQVENSWQMRQQGRLVQVGLLIGSIKEYVGQKGKMAFCQVEDLTGIGELTVLPKVYAQYRDLIHSDQPLLVTARLSNSREKDEEGEEVKLLLEEVSLLKNIYVEIPPVSIQLEAKKLPQNWESGLFDLFEKYPGSRPVTLELELEESRCLFQFGSDFQIEVCPQFWQDMKAWKAGFSQHV